MNRFNAEHILATLTKKNISREAAIAALAHRPAESASALLEGQGEFTSEDILAIAESFDVDVGDLIDLRAVVPELMQFKTQWKQSQKELSQEFLACLFDHVYRGAVTYRWAANFVGLSLGELHEMFEERGLGNPLDL